MNAQTNKKRRPVKQYDSLADLMADKKRAAELAKRSHHNSVRYSHGNVKSLKPEDVLVKYNDRRRTGKTARERASGEANQRYQNRLNRSKYSQPNNSLTNKNDSMAGRDEASKMFSEYCGSCNGKRTRAIRAAAEA